MTILQDVTLGRMKLITLLAGSDKESVGDALDVQGAVVAAGDPGARAFTPQLPIRASVADPNAQTTAQRLRRQLRAYMENDIARLQGTYFQWSVDPELNGWLLLGRADIEPAAGGGIAMSDWNLTISDGFLLGNPRTHRPARTLRVWDRRLSTTPRDILGVVYSTDFAARASLPLHFLPVGASDALGTGRAVMSVATRQAIDGALGLLTGQVDSQVVSYEQAEADRAKGAVVILDRKTFTAPAYTLAGDTDPQTVYGWEEIYGPNQPLTAGDVPVLENGVCRLRWDPTNTPGFRVDMFVAGTGYVEQCKVTAQRYDGGWFTDDTLVSVAVVEWTPERAVLKLVMAVGGMATSREEIYVTLQRGWTGPRFEGYPANLSNATKGDMAFVLTPAVVDSNISVMRPDIGAAGSVMQATAGTGSALFLGFANGAFTSTSDNELIILRQGAAYGIVMATLVSGFGNQGVSDVSTDSAYGTPNAYGASRNTFLFDPTSRHAGYATLQLGFIAQTTDQIMEAEAIRFASGTTSQVADATGSAGQIVRDTQVASTANTLRKSTNNMRTAKYRMMARVRTNGGTGSFTGFATQSAINTAGAWQWVDLGEGTIVNGANPFAINAWRGTATSVDIDRVELFKLEDRTIGLAPGTYDGGRDLGQSVLADCRQIPELVAR